MYRNLNAAGLGISARQSELIETALTFGFRGVDMDIADVIKRAKTLGAETAAQLLKSSNLRIASFDLPVKWEGDDASFQAALQELQPFADMAAAIGAEICRVPISPISDRCPYHENFELHRQRLAQIAELLAQHDVRLGIALQPTTSARQNGNYEFIYETEALITLLKTISSPNVGLALDTWDFFVGGGSMETLQELKVAQIASVRLANAPQDFDRTTISTEQRLLPDDEGVIDAAAVVRHLGELNYEGPVSVCAHPAAFPEMTRDAIVQRVRESFDQLWKSAGITKAGRLATVGTQE